jgi:hypothetical protein
MVTIQVAPIDHAQDYTSCAAPSIVGPTLEVARLAARSMGATFNQHERGFDIGLPVRLAACDLASTGATH